MHDTNTTSLTTELQTCLAEAGVRGVLAYLNQRVTHRFTALHIKDIDVLKSVYVHDRDNPAAKPFTDLPVEENFYALIFATGQPLVINDAAQDQSLAKSAQAAHCKAYCGLPLYRSDGSIFGALCHYDLQPRDLSAKEIAILHVAGRMLSTTLNDIAAL